MEPTTIAIAAVGYIALQIAEGGLKEVGKEIYAKVKACLLPKELITLDLLEKHPKSEEIKGEVAGILTGHLEKNSTLTDELAELLKQVPASQIKQNTIDIKGDDNIAVQDISGGSVNINK